MTEPQLFSIIGSVVGVGTTLAALIVGLIAWVRSDVEERKASTLRHLLPRAQRAGARDPNATLPLLPHMEAEPFEDPVQHAEVATIVNDEPTHASVNAGLGPKRLGQVPLQATDVGIIPLGSTRLDTGIHPPPSHERLGRPYRQPVLENALRHALLPAGVAERHERTRMACREAAGRDILPDPRGKLQKAKSVADVAPRAPAFPREPGNFAVRKASVAAPPRKLRFELSCLLDRIGPLAAARKAQDLGCLRIVNLVPQHDWNFIPARALRGEPGLGVGQDLVPKRARTHDDRIDRPVSIDQTRKRQRNIRQRTRWPQPAEMKLLDPGPARHIVTVQPPTVFGCPRTHA